MAGQKGEKKKEGVGKPIDPGANPLALTDTS